MHNAICRADYGNIPILPLRFHRYCESIATSGGQNAVGLRNNEKMRWAGRGSTLAFLRDDMGRSHPRNCA